MLVDTSTADWWLPPVRMGRMRADHSNLLASCFDQRLPSAVDLMVVPSVRPAADLEMEALPLAAELGCPLLVLSSRDSEPGQVAELMVQCRGAAAHLGPDPLPGIDLPTLQADATLDRTYYDRAVKRNVGLVVARLMGFERVLFLDDDIFDLASWEVGRAARYLGAKGMRTVGWRARRFPDNSNVGHAHRTAERDQGVFIGTTALLVHMSSLVPFFPAVYNEDWLFIHEFLRSGRAGCAGSVRQVPFNPFEDLERSRIQEFGDVLAEGLFGLVHERRSVLVACFPAYWEAMVADRNAFLDDIEQRLWRRRDQGKTLSWNGFRLQQILLSLNSSREALSTIRPADLAEFVSAWRYDLYGWRSRLANLPRLSRLSDALSWVGLTNVHLAGV